MFFTKLSQALKNFRDAQWSPLYSPAFLGDVPETLDAWKDRGIKDSAKLQEQEPSGYVYEIALSSGGFRLDITFFLIVIFTIYHFNWSFILQGISYEIASTTLIPLYFQIVLIIAATNIITLVFVGITTTHSLLLTIIKLPRALLLTLPFSFFPSVFLPHFIFTESIFFPHPNRFLFVYNHHKAWLAGYYVALFRKESLGDALKSISQTWKARPLTIYQGCLILGLNAFLALSAYLLLFIVVSVPFIFVEAEAPLGAFFEFGFACLLCASHYLTYKYAILVNHLDYGYQALREARMAGKYIPDTIELLELQRVSYENFSGVNQVFIAKIMSEKMGMEDPHCFIGPIKPSNLKIKTEFWSDVFNNRARAAMIEKLMNSPRS